MKSFSMMAWCALGAFLLSSGSASANAFFKKQMQAHYSVKSVSCNICHVKGKKKNREVLTDFGKVYGAALAGKDITERLKAAKKAGDKDKNDAVKAAVKKEFQEAMEMIEKKAYPGGGTYGDAIKEAKLEGVKLE